MKKIKFYKLYPSGNPTILVEDLSLSAKQMILASQEILEHLQAEQVGFIDCSTNTLTMMGGEFCINATRSFAHILADKAKIQNKNQEYTVNIKTSGQEIEALVYSDKSTVTALTIDYSHFAIKKIKDYTYVVLDGITHILVAITNKQDFDFMVESNKIRANLNINDLAVGVIWYYEEAESYTIIPIVHVLATSTNYYESACGTGSLALALYLYQEFKLNQVTINQPSGMSLQVNFLSGNKVQISGFSKIIAEGYVYLYSI